MTLLIENRYLPALIPFLESMKLAGAHSRARSKLLTMALTAYGQLAVSEKELASEYAVLGVDGQPVIDEDGVFELKNPDEAPAYLAAREELLSESAVLDGSTYAEHLSQLNELLGSYSVELSGDDAAVYDHLYDAVEAALTREGGA